MATKTDFSAAEWDEVLGSVMVAGMAVTLADPSGLIGMIKEGLASGGTLVAAKTDPSGNKLARSVVADFGTSEGRSAAKEFIKKSVADKRPAERKTALLAVLSRVGDIVASKAPADAPGFRSWIAHISQSVAEAAEVDSLALVAWVSDADKAALEEISRH